MVGAFRDEDVAGFISGMIPTVVMAGLDPAINKGGRW
jgi:hypothetical protein